MSLVLMFPGQSSRYPEMIEKVTAPWPASLAVIARASEVVGRDLGRHYRADNDAVFATNRDVQLGVFLANHLHLRRLESMGITSSWSMGLSLGEYNHLVHIGALAFEDALTLVEARGRLYDEAVGGLMVSLFPVEAALVEETVAGLALGDRVAIGLYNSPRQQVLSGDRAAVEQVVAKLDEDHHLDATVIEPRIPMHAPVFEPIGSRLRPILDATPVTRPALPYVPNVLGSIVDAATVEDIRDCLTAHTHRAVRWQASVEAVAARLGSPCFVEVGPRAVLSSLFRRGWAFGRRGTTDAIDDWSEHLRTLARELSRAS